MLTGFEKQNAEMEKFEKSKLYEKAYKGLVHKLYLEINREPIYADFFCALYGINKAEVRSIIRHARRSGHPLASSEKGYWVETNFDKLMTDGIANLNERISSLQFTVSRMRKLCPDKCRDQISFLGKLKVA